MPLEDGVFSSSQGLMILGKQGREAPLHPSTHPPLPTFPLVELLATMRDSSFSSASSCTPLLLVYKYSTIYILIPYHMVRLGYEFIHFNMRKISILQAMLRSQY